MHVRYCGQSIAEYGLIGGCVLVIVMLSLKPLGTVLSGLYKNMIPSPHQVVAVGATNVPPFTTGSLPGGTFPIPCPTGKNCGSVTLPPVNPSVAAAMDMKDTVMTLGANGTIKVMADKVRLLTSQLVASGELTEEEAGIFNDLANQGYRIGEISGMIEQTASACGSSTTCFTSKTVTLDNKQVSMDDLANMIGYKPLSDDPSDTSNNPEVAALWNIYRNLPSSVWQNPELKSVVTSLTTEIGQVSNQVMWANSNIKNGYLKPDGMRTYMVGQAQGTIPESGLGQATSSAEGIINGDATTTCVLGDGTTNGKKCQNKQ
jgi:hypothetical protein